MSAMSAVVVVVVGGENWAAPTVGVGALSREGRPGGGKLVGKGR